MNQKNYKEISKIIGKMMKEYRKRDASVVGHGLFTLAKLSYYLVDYFEREEFNTYNQANEKQQFNKKQFLKDCGVE